MKTCRKLILLAAMAFACALASGCHMGQLPGPPGLPPSPPLPLPGR